MSTCYRCGSFIEPHQKQPRRRVTTGEHRVRRKDRARELVHRHYGLRILCARCARFVDYEEHRRQIVEHASVVIALAALIAFLLLAK